MVTLHACLWADAHGSTGTIATHEIEHKPYHYTTVGFLVRSDEIGVSIAFEQGEDGRWRDVTFIPRSLVVHEELLGEWRNGRLRKRNRKPVKDGHAQAEGQRDAAVDSRTE
jgi:hypothetical protein